MQIKLKTITCHVPDESDKDEIFIKYQGKKIWPKKVKFLRIDANQTLKVDVSIDITSGWKDIELWEYDFLSRNDHLGNFYLKADNYPGQYSNDLDQNQQVSEKAKYTLNWELIR